MRARTTGGVVTNRVKVGFFSLSEALAPIDDRRYLRWHQLDHMPEQYQLPGLVFGQRWASTPQSRALRLVAAGRWARIDHVVCYLMGDPVESTLDDFAALGRRLAELGRYPVALPSVFAGATRWLAAEAAPPALVSAEVVPFRPNRGIYLIVAEPAENDADVDSLLLEAPGVAGVWTFETGPAYRKWQRTEGEYRFKVCYLDGDPCDVAGQIGGVVEAAWRDKSSRLLLAGPYASLVPWVWD
jgi:hypothetical protein